MSEDVVIRRVIAAPREEVFAAWLDPEMLAKFMRPGEQMTATAQVDARVGGTFRIVMQHSGDSVDHWGEYQAIEPPSLLSFTWISKFTDVQPSVVTIELRDDGAGGTELTLTHRRLPPSQLDAHRNGWTKIVETLSGVV
ncbi:MAG TPA: SRPBCC domain-containing protein [Gemmatimonadaceae bacterium]|nr:SRPBCC domain-containing protein [Gemmatimonadaceae bacterium]